MKKYTDKQLASMVKDLASVTAKMRKLWYKYDISERLDDIICRDIEHGDQEHIVDEINNIDGQLDYLTYMVQQLIEKK